MRSQNSPAHVQVAIIGSGFGGLGTAMQLKHHGINDFVVFERAGDVGGVWRDNQYPGAACDTQSHLYSFSLAPNAHWSRSFSPQQEIWANLRRCAQDWGVLSHIRFHHTVRDATWDFWRRLARFVPTEYHITPTPAASARGTAPSRAEVARA